MTRAALWSRVSTGEQATANQVVALRRWAQNRGLEVVREWEVTESAWNGEHRAKMNEVLNAARLGEFEIVLTWSLDRLSREGVEATLQLLRQLRERGVSVWSMQESWTETTDPRMAELLGSLFAWIAAEESRRRSERIRAAIARKRADGSWTGRGKDRGRRKRAGYFRREARKRESA